MLLKRLRERSSAWNIFLSLQINYSSSTLQGPCSHEITLLGHWHLLHQLTFIFELSQHNVQFLEYLWLSSHSHFTSRSSSRTSRFESESLTSCTNTRAQPRQLQGQHPALGSPSTSTKPA